VSKKEGALVIIDQIKERELIRLKENELREKEGLMMVAQIKEL